MSLEKLFEGADLTEDFKEKLTTIYTAAVADGVAEKEKALQEDFDAKLQSQLDEEIESLGEKVNDYLKYVTQEFMEENKLAVETGLKVEMMESFFDGMKQLFEAHGVEVPEGKEDVVETLTNKVAELESKLDEATDAQIAAQKAIDEKTRSSVLKTVAEGLTDIQAEKLAVLTEGLEFVSEEDFTAKAQTVREVYFTEEAEGDDAGIQLDEGEGVDIDEDKVLDESDDKPEATADDLTEDEDPEIAGFTRALDLFSNK